MAVNVELWQDMVENELFKDNEILTTMKNADEYVIGGRAVHIPQSGGPSDVIVNDPSVPVTGIIRNDTDVIYLLNEFKTRPRVITNIDTVELSYDKMASVVEEDTGALEEAAVDLIIYDVAKEVPAPQKIATTGDGSAAGVGNATGLRKAMTEADLRAAAVQLNKQNVPKKDRYCVVDADMFDQLWSDEKLRDTFQRTVDLEKGIIGQYAGFKILMRSTVLRVDGSAGLKAPSAADAADDAAAAIFYQKNCVEKALGEIKTFDKSNDPNYYGDVVSFLVRSGSRARRQDNKGYGIIYRAAA